MFADATTGRSLLLPVDESTSQVLLCQACHTAEQVLLCEDEGGGINEVVTPYRDELRLWRRGTSRTTLVR
jgi:hypothetical protein